MGRFLTNHVSLPSPVVEENKIVPPVARKKRKAKRGRPSLLYEQKGPRAQQKARVRVMEAADGNVHAVISTARAFSAAEDPELAFILKEFSKDPSLKTHVFTQLKRKKKGLGNSIHSFKKVYLRYQAVYSLVIYLVENIRPF